MASGLIVAAGGATQTGDLSGLQKAGAIAAIVGASIAVILFVAGLVRWWWRNHRVRSVKIRIFESGEEKYLEILGLPASTEQVTALVSDGKETMRCGPAPFQQIRRPEHLFNIRRGQPELDESIRRYKVEIFTTSHRGDQHRVFKGKVDSNA